MYCSRRGIEVTRPTQNCSRCGRCNWERNKSRETTGTVVCISRQWWLKINTKPIRLHSTDGAVFPHIITASYTVDGRTYRKKKWISPGSAVPPVGSSVTVVYDATKPEKAKIL